jgi:hypothetical protein
MRARVDEALAHRCEVRLAGDGRDPAERARLARLMARLATLPPPPDPDGLVPRYGELLQRFLDASRRNDGDALEERFLELYAHLHMNQAPYTAAERQQLNRTGGYWNHAGGLSPLLKAADWIDEATVSADYGAGNGLQGLLLQDLYPHARTIQIDLSARALAFGLLLQGWLGIPEERVEWVHADVLNVPPRGMDFIYLYRPVRPQGRGRLFYERFAATLAEDGRPVVIFSVADCLREFLPDGFEQFHGDGHLTCYRRS